MNIPDNIYPSDNEYGIPTLPLSACADSLVIPFLVWGFQRRSRRAGTLAFYTDDYRFDIIWSNPERILVAMPSVVIEPNWTLQNDQPLAVALFQTFRKRWMAVRWAALGIKIVVDLNVGSKYSTINQLGIPQGWRAFATRGSVNDIEGLYHDYKIAQEFNADPLFVVYGGGYAVGKICQDNGWMHIAERMDRHGK